MPATVRSSEKPYNRKRNEASAIEAAVASDQRGAIVARGSNRAAHALTRAATPDRAVNTVAGRKATSRSNSDTGISTSSYVCTEWQAATANTTSVNKPEQSAQLSACSSNR